VMSVAASAPVLLAGMVATGVAGAFIWIPAPGLAGSVVSEDRRGFAIGLMASGIGVAILFASQLTRVVHALYGENAWRPVWTVEASLTVLATLVAFRWLREPEDRAHQKASTLQEILRLESLRAVPGWMGITAAYVGYGLCYSIYSSYLVAALESDAGFGTAHASLDYALIGLALTAGGILLGRLSDRIGRRPTLVWGFVAMGLCPLSVLTAAEPWIGGAALAFGVMMSGLGSVVAAYVRDHTSEGAFAPAFGAITLFFGTAQLVGPELGGFLAEQSGTFTVAFVVSAVAGLGGAAASASLPVRVRPRP
jgi:predicted MFS family arabinose efflux permease